MVRVKVISCVCVGWGDGGYMYIPGADDGTAV